MQISIEDHKKIKSRVAQLDQAFEPYKGKAKDIQRYVCPWRGRFLSGDHENQNRDALYDDSSIHNTIVFEAIDIGAAGIKSGVSPSSRPWFKIGGHDKKLAELRGPSQWLSFVGDVIEDIFQRSNTYDSLQEIYSEDFVFGAGYALVEGDLETVIRLHPFSYGEYRVAHDHAGRLNVFLRRFWKSAGALVEEFGEEHVSDAVRQAYNDGNLETQFRCNMLIEANDDRLEVKDALGRPWRALYWQDGAPQGHFLAVRGFDVFPVIGGPWDMAGSRGYGIGPGHKNLRNCKRLQIIEEESLQQLALHTRPPMKSDGANKSVLIDASPWGMTRTTGSFQNGSGVEPLYRVQPNTRDLEEKIKRTETSIDRGFYKDIFLMLANGAQDIDTAYQAAKMLEEKYTVLGPVIERSLAMLGQLIQLTFHFANEAGLIPEPPPELQGQELKIEYVSILAQAQQIAGLQSIEETMGFVRRIEPFWPEARYKIDALQAVDEVASTNGAPPSMIRSDDEAAALMEQDQKRQAAQEAGQAALMAAEGASKLKGVEVGGRSAIDVLTGSR